MKFIKGVLGMKKSNFAALLMGIASGMLFALGMCMTLLPEWQAMTEGIIMGLGGLVLGAVTYVVWCRMEHRPLPKLNLRSVLFIGYIVLSLLVLGIGLCLCLVGARYFLGAIIGVVGILMLVMLIPMTVGLK
jgi:hypothetical protein